VLKCRHFGSHPHLVRRFLRARPSVEQLESRHLPSGVFAAAPLVLGTVPSSKDAPENLGTLTPENLNGGVTVLGTFHSQTADYFQFQVTRSHEVVISLLNQPSSTGIPAGTWLTLTNVTAGQPVFVLPLGNISNPASQVASNGQVIVLGGVDPGNVYVLQVNAWSAAGDYTLHLSYPGEQPEMPQPLAVGSGPTVRLQLLNPGTTAPVSPTSASAPAAPPVIGTAAPAPLLPAFVPVVGGSTGVLVAGVPVGASNPVEPPASIPSSVYVALGAGSVGGGTNIGNLNTPRDLYDRLYGQEPALALNDRVVGLAILSQVSTTSGSSFAAAREGQDLQGWWQNLLRRFGQTSAAVSTATAESVLKADASPEDEEEALLRDPAEVRGFPEMAFPDRGSYPALRPEAALAISVLFAALVARQRRQRPPALTVRRIQCPHEFTA
jgi:hypothetical protein